MTTYTPTTPVATDFPSTSQPQMLGNNQYLISGSFALGTYGTGLQRDHNMLLDSTIAGDGTHRQVTFASNLNPAPGFAGGVGVLYSKTANGGSQLFYQNALISDVQLTAAKVGVPTVAASGVTFLPGGLLLQWGTGTPGATITFPVAFNAAGFPPVVTATQFFTVPSAICIDSGPPQSIYTSFRVNGSLGGATFKWMAIGQA